jgi:hypothetical protein
MERGNPVDEADPVARLLPKIKTMDPRAVAGTLEELLLLAAFTKALMTGAAVWAGNHAGMESSNSDETRMAGRSGTRPLVLRTNDTSR